MSGFFPVTLAGFAPMGVAVPIISEIKTVLLRTIINYQGPPCPLIIIVSALVCVQPVHCSVAAKADLDRGLVPMLQCVTISI
jgi:hypothetical protein